MAATTGKRTSSSKRNTSKKTNTRNTNRSKQRTSKQQNAKDYALIHEIGLIVLFVFMVFLFCCNFGLIGEVGDYISGILFGCFGFTAYIAPILLFLAMAFHHANIGNPSVTRKIIAGVILFVMLGITSELITKNAINMDNYNLKMIYDSCKDTKAGGGIIAGSIAYVLYDHMELFGTILIVLLFTVISIVLLTEKSIINGVKTGGSILKEKTLSDAQRRKEYNRLRQDAYEEQRMRKEEERIRREEQRRLKIEKKENEKILRMEKKVSGVMLDTSLRNTNEVKRRDDIHEITLLEEEELLNNMDLAQGDFDESNKRKYQSFEKSQSSYEEDPLQNVVVHSIHQEEAKTSPQAEKIRIHKEEPKENADIPKEISGNERKQAKTYMFPPLSRLQKGVAVSGDSTQELKKTALRLQQTLNTFGVKVTVTDISQGPSVTRYELQPEQGVKVSKIVGLSDDIKLNLAATDIRIEAPIPGKAAVGIEVPNKENMVVALRDLLEGKEFKDFPSNIAFAVGKDIAGKTIVADIAKMPHMLIAGATGSGKSVCINTLIMSILYKAHPDDVKLIMVDPKVVELSVYNGIPHLLIPVVTDPKKAAAALHWGVTEMEDRYRKFADYNVRDLKGYNKKLESMQEGGEDGIPGKLPQIIIIVDELADLMMVCPGEVEESICRLAQLARAAGIHLIIATQRPSVDVITGLIKANMPSRVAFAVSSGVDSRTILDMNGAEKLLGKGDMLFYPQGYSKPARIQGAFVSDREVSDVVDFLKNQQIGNTYASDIEEKIVSIGTSGGTGAGLGNNSGRDEYFAEAGKLIINKDKASIGMLQMVFKIGFNRAARIMEQLGEYGVVGENEGTKPRKILMSMEEFEQLLEEIN